jgi:hypothetical protein
MIRASANCRWVGLFVNYAQRRWVAIWRPTWPNNALAAEVASCRPRADGRWLFRSRVLLDSSPERRHASGQHSLRKLASAVDHEVICTSLPQAPRGRRLPNLAACEGLGAKSADPRRVPGCAPREAGED